VSLVRSYADGKTDDEAFEGAIGMDVAAFNEAWLADIGAEAPVKYGPQPAAPGPRPSDWGATPSQPPVVAPTPTSPDVVSRRAELEAVDLGPITLWLALFVVVGAIVVLVLSRTRSTAR
jgi:hypothetical protein